jgi:hypothetical protein
MRKVWGPNCTPHQEGTGVSLSPAGTSCQPQVRTLSVSLALCAARSTRHAKPRSNEDAATDPP